MADPILTMDYVDRELTMPTRVTEEGQAEIHRLARLITVMKGEQELEQAWMPPARLYMPYYQHIDAAHGSIYVVHERVGFLWVGPRYPDRLNHGDLVSVSRDVELEGTKAIVGYYKMLDYERLAVAWFDFTSHDRLR